MLFWTSLLTLGKEVLADLMITPTCRRFVTNCKLDLEKLRRLQKETADEVILKDVIEEPIETITGFDVAFFDDEAVVAAVSFDYETLVVREKDFLKEKTLFPYIPTFLSFREGYLITKLAKKLKIEPDVLMLDSQGVAHPLFCGCASHVGVLVNKPTIGVAKSRLCGEYDKKPVKVGDWIPLVYQGRTVGSVLLSKRGCNPIYISPGHMITLETAVRVVKHFLLGYKTPEPIRLAHRLANDVKKSLTK